MRLWLVRGSQLTGRTGASPYAINSRNQYGVSTNDAYLEPARGRANLSIVGGAMVDRVEFDGSRAVAVRVRTGGKWQRVEGGEIILSAGAIHSPAILMRSGIGPADELRTLGIQVRTDAPVGRNLLDHPQLSMQLDLKVAARAPTLSASHQLLRALHLRPRGCRDQRHDVHRLQSARRPIRASSLWLYLGFGLPELLARKADNRLRRSRCQS